MDEFIAPIVEVIEDNNIEIEEQILAAYNNKEKAANSEDSNKEPVAKVTLKQAIEAIKIRILYKEQYSNSELDKL